MIETQPMTKHGATCERDGARYGRRDTCGGFWLRLATNWGMSGRHSQRYEGRLLLHLRAMLSAQCVFALGTRFKVVEDAGITATPVHRCTGALAGA